MQALLPTPAPVGSRALPPPASRFARLLLGWVALGVLAYALLPWYFLQKGTLTAALPLLWRQADVGSGLAQALLFERSWLWGGVLGLLLASVAPLLPGPRSQGRMAVAGALGLGAVGAVVGNQLAFARLSESYAQSGTLDPATTLEVEGWRTAATALSVAALGTGLAGAAVYLWSLRLEDGALEVR